MRSKLQRTFATYSHEQPKFNAVQKYNDLFLEYTNPANGHPWLLLKQKLWPLLLCQGIIWYAFSKSQNKNDESSVMTQHFEKCCDDAIFDPVMTQP